MGEPFMEDIRFQEQQRLTAARIPMFLTPTHALEGMAKVIPFDRRYPQRAPGSVDYHAEDAKCLSLVNHVVPHEKLSEEPDMLVPKTLGNAPLVLRAIKEIAIRDRDMNTEDRVRFAETLSEQLRQRADATEGLAAFREKRQPA
jgi:hypothetical protein